MANVKHVNYYTNVLARWSKADLGKMPTEAQLAVAHVFGRPGKQSLAVAMALRDTGVSGKQIKLAAALFDGRATPQLNHIRDLVASKSFTRENVPGVYAITLAPNGQRFIDLHGAKAAAKTETTPVKAAAVKGKAKVKAKGKVAPAETPISDVATVTEAAIDAAQTFAAANHAAE